MRKVTVEQIEKAKIELAKKVLDTQDSWMGYPIRTDGSKDFSGQPVENRLTEEEVIFLVNRFFSLRMSGKSEAESIRMSYGCCYKKGTGTFHPRRRIEEIKAAK